MSLLSLIWVLVSSSVSDNFCLSFLIDFSRLLMSEPLELETEEVVCFFLRVTDDPSDVLSFSLIFNCVGDGGVTDSSGVVVNTLLLTG